MQLSSHCVCISLAEAGIAACWQSMPTAGSTRDVPAHYLLLPLLLPLIAVGRDCALAKQNRSHAAHPPATTLVWVASSAGCCSTTSGQYQTLQPRNQESQVLTRCNFRVGWELGRVLQLHSFASGQHDAAGHGGRRHDHARAVLLLQPLAEHLRKHAAEGNQLLMAAWCSLVPCVPYPTMPPQPQMPRGCRRPASARADGGYQNKHMRSCGRLAADSVFLP